MAWGPVKRIVVADRLAELANRVYDAPRGFTGLPLVTGTVAFAFQIYCDFSGYSDIAIGSAQVMGFTLMKNFDRPYTARSVAEFWRRWHISLSTWFRDYLYIPLGGNRVARPRWYVNLFVTFVVSGLWHGARWTFVVWGALHGAYLVGSHVSAGARARLRKGVGLGERPALLRAWQTGATFLLVGVAWVFFRASTLGDASYVLTHLASGLGAQLSAILSRDPAAISSLVFLGFEGSKLAVAAAAVIALLVIERVQGAAPVPLRVRIAGARAPLRWAAYMCAVLTIMTLGAFQSATFIYFQF
jgi:D-alanyl-lipoteichoic acid acyltransferase DltB (MBOAT superfamily)